MTAVSNPARLFVQTIVSGYDNLCHLDKVKIPDVFNPHLEAGLKETSLELFSEELSTAGMGFDQAKFNEEVVTAYKPSSPTLSHLFANTGILDALPQESGKQNVTGKLQKAKNYVIEALAQDHLRSKKNYTLDPMASIVLLISSMAVTMGKPNPLPQFANGKSHFYSQIFLEVYCRSASARTRPSAPLTKEKIIALLKDFEPELESRSFRLQRVVFKIERMFNDVIANRYLKFGVSIACAAGSYLLINKVIAVAGIVFNSAAFAGISSGVVSYMPALVVQISSGAYNYAASTRLYGFLFHLGKMVPMVISNRLPLAVAGFCYERAFGPSARVQEAIAESLKKCKDPKVKQELLEEGMKAYQIWMYLVEQGPQKGLFEAALA